MNTELISRLREFIENEMRSCSMEYFWFKVHGEGLMIQVS